MISRAREAEILRLHHTEKWPVGTIASQLGIHHSTVKRVLAQAGLEAGRRSAQRREDSDDPSERPLLPMADSEYASSSRGSSAHERWPPLGAGASAIS